jgi:hypothetical protein
MKARDLNGQYARWQVLLQEYDFVIEHRAGVKHNNADVLSRFPIQNDRDVSGARFDVDEGKVATMLKTRPVAKLDPLRPSLIDSFAPRFKDIFHKGNPHIDENHYMDAVMRDPTQEELDPKAHKRVMAMKHNIEGIVSALRPVFKSRMEAAIQDASQKREWFKAPYFGAGQRTHALDTSVVGPHFNSVVEREGLSLMELCGGICTGLDSLLRCGVKINEYFYIDKDPIAREVARHRLVN